MDRRPPFVPRHAGVVPFIAMAGLAMSGVLRGDWWMPGIAIGFLTIHVILWLLSPHVSGARKAIAPGPDELRRMNAQAETLEKSRIPGLGWLARTSYKGQPWRTREVDEPSDR